MNGATIQNVSAFTVPPQVIAGTNVANGHRFDFVIQMDFDAGTNGSSDCTLEWWEKTNVPALTGHPANTWTEMFAQFSTSPTFDPWNKRTIPCPAGGSLTVTIVDIPSLGAPPGVTQSRTLEFRLVAKSGPSCSSCFRRSYTATATQVLVMVNGTLDSSKSSFTIGPSSSA